MSKPALHGVAIALLCWASASSAQAPANDKLTGISVFPSLSGDDERIPGGICRIAAQTVIYLVPFLWGPNHTAAAKQTAVDDVNQWYQSHLKDFRLIHGSDGQRSEDVFLSSDGTKAVKITGNPAPSKGAYAVSFTLFSGSVRLKQVKSLASRQNIQC